MARQRNFRAEYERRLELGRSRGLSRQEARGHARTPERPLGALRNPTRYSDTIRRRFDFYEALARTALGAAALARVNARRIRAGKGPILIERPALPGPRIRQTTWPNFEEAEPHGAGVPPPYVRYYLHPDGVTVEIERGERQRRRRAA